jgi:Zn-dependent peptidase ImmA (M78 family)/transcriptional regulator with XRE-family HTH domain
MTFNPSRLTLARKRRGANKIRVAELVGLTTRSISAFENFEKTPSPETLEKIAAALDFPVEFFFGPDLDIPSSKSASFRSLSRMSAAQRDAALGAGALSFLLNDWMAENFELPDPNVPSLRGEDPETAAIVLRDHWGLGDRPIRNMVHLLEANGIRVFSLVERNLEVDAFSVYRGDQPFVFLNTQKSSEHGRFDAAHELGHLVLHRHGAPVGQDAEKEANAFASAFLMPASSVFATGLRYPSVSDLVAAKSKWLVSVSALAYRLHSIKLITDWHYRSLFIELSERGYRKAEPNSVQRESSQILAKVFSSIRAEGSSIQSLADQLAISVRDINDLVFGLMLTVIDGTGSPQASGKSASPRLSLVK